MSPIKIYKKRSKLTQQAIDYLKSTLFAENPDNCPSYLRLLITASHRESCSDLYEVDIKIFKLLFNTGNTNHRMALWNSIATYYDEKTKFYRKDFTSEEFAFIKAATFTQQLPIYETNVNKPIVTDRLVLRAIE